MKTDSSTDGERPAEDDFLTRWSRRKQTARADGTVPEAQVDDPAEVAATPEDATPVPVDEDMPPVETLDERSDVSGFFSSGVSEALRRRALRRIFHLDRYHHRDGLDDYDADYRNFQPLGDVMTADRRLRQERLAQRAAELLEEQAAEQEETEGIIAGGGDGDPTERDPGAAG